MLKPGKLLSSIAFLSIACTGFAIAHGNTAGDNTLAINPKNWSTFDDKTSGFTMRYPRGLKINKIFPTGYFQSGSWRTYGFGNGKLILNIPIIHSQFSGNDRFAFYFHIGSSSDPKEVKNCLNAAGQITEEDGKVIKTKTINGATFQVIEFTDVAMSKVSSLTSYRIIHNGQCFAIEKQIDYSQSNLNKADQQRIEQLIAQGNELTDSMINTLTFKK